MLKIRNLYAYYGPVTALSGVTCHIKEGEIVALIGANGAGKTTLLNAVCGLVRTKGEVTFQGQEVSRLAAERLVGLGISQVPEGRQLFAPMTVAENLELGAYLRRGRQARAGIARDLERVFSLFPVLKDRQGQQAGTMSGGEQQMLAIARALMARPQALASGRALPGARPPGGGNHSGHHRPSQGRGHDHPAWWSKTPGPRSRWRRGPMSSRPGA